MTSRRTVHTCKVAALVAILMLLALAGCDSDDPAKPDPDPDPETSYQWPDTREKLMENFEQAYVEMDIDEYDFILHDDFIFIFTDTEVWTRLQDIQSTTNMFSGEQGEYGDGWAVLGVQSIAVHTFNQIGVWERQEPTHPYFPDTDQGLFDVQIVFYLEGGEHTLTVSSEQLFYVKSEEVDDGEGGTRTRCFLAGQRDLGSGLKTNEDMTWGSVKALYL